MHRHHVNWRYYVFQGGEPDCENARAIMCGYVSQSAGTPGIWNPLPHFATVQEDHQLKDIQALALVLQGGRARQAPGGQLDRAQRQGLRTPPSAHHDGQTYVTGLINAIMRSPDWYSTAIFLSWDDWGGFYDNVSPPASIRTATASASPVS